MAAVNIVLSLLCASLLGFIAGWALAAHLLVVHP